MSRMSALAQPPAPRTAPADQAPPVVLAATSLWLFAVAAGVFEAVLIVTQMLSSGTAFGELLPQIAFRLGVFAAAVFLALRLRAGRNWARLTLAVGLGIFGTLSLVIEPARWLLGGGSIGDALAAWAPMDFAFAGSRILHLLAVLGAVTLMFQPRANAFFRGRPA
ncbi:hypothetical protein HTZ77_39235 [Nonomuraea sp. SMC257]|uniref:DUF4149 domain-containing protein n=1 Tax=Nonomuraea montanisoli TaxID=2741721 RepID=A0A7Y6IFX4_9ACTN|nr:hypothetical protein [Nonomuraea montanisoli]NUW37392.1 hypothetical protein [Nonomuraea montanisoli]